MQHRPWPVETRVPGVTQALWRFSHSGRNEHHIAIAEQVSALPPLFMGELKGALVTFRCQALLVLFEHLLRSWLNVVASKDAFKSQGLQRFPNENDIQDLAPQSHGGRGGKIIYLSSTGAQPAHAFVEKISSRVRKLPPRRSIEQADMGRARCVHRADYATACDDPSQQRNVRHVPGKKTEGVQAASQCLMPVTSALP